MSTRCDAIVVGGGHNGLVTAAYLARAGLRVVVLERRPVTGGPLATDELVPGARVPTFAHTAGRLAGSVARDLSLAAHGLRLVQPAVRAVALRPGEPPIVLWGDPGRTAAGLAARSTVDSRAWVRTDAEVRAIAGLLARLHAIVPPDPSALAIGDLPGLVRLGLGFHGLDEAHARELFRALPQPVADFLEDRFALEPLRAALAIRGIRYSGLSPTDAGSTQLLLADSAGNEGGLAGETVYVRGGPAALATALERAATAAGAVVRTGATVAAIRTRDERVAGVTLADGTLLDAPIVASGLDPRRTLLELLDPEVLGPRMGWEAGNLRARGVTAKVNLALAGLPALDGIGADPADPRLRGRILVAPGMRGLELGALAARAGRLPDEPWLEATIPSLADPLLVDGAAAGVRHVMSILVQPVPYALREGTWDERREALGDLVMARLEAVAPGIGDLVVARRTITPLDLERELGLTGGHPMHLEPALDAWFAWRPLAGLARHAMPVEGLWLCGSGAHPGGGITGLPGRNAAREILAARRRAS